MKKDVGHKTYKWGEVIGAIPIVSFFMEWLSNNDPPLYVWADDYWYNQKTKLLYKANVTYRVWLCENLDIIKEIFLYSETIIEFPKKTKVMSNIDK